MVRDKWSTDPFIEYLIIPPAELRKLTAQRKEFGTLESLCIDLCGGVTAAGRMLYRLLQWWTKTRHPDGWVYKSHADWYGELRISQKELPKANAALELAGVEVKTLKGRLPAPCKHYRLIAGRFIAALSKRLGLGIEWLKNFCAGFAKSISPKGQNRNAEKGKIDFAKSGTSSTIFTTDSSSLNKHSLNSNNSDGAADSNENSTASALDEQDAQEGASDFEESARHEADNPNPPVPATPLPREVQRLVEYPIETKRLPMELAREYVEKYGELRCTAAATYSLGPGVDKPAGMFRWVLDQTDWFMTTPKAVPAADEDAGKTAEIYEETDEVEVVTEIDPLPYIDPERAALWRSAFAQLEIQLDRNSFDTWLRDAWLIRFEDETFVIGVRNKYAVDMLTYRLNRTIQRVFDDAAGAPVQLKFEVATMRQDSSEEMPPCKLLKN